MIDNKRAIIDIIQPGIFESGIQFHTVLVDADMARELLAHNRKPEQGKSATNRKQSATRVATYLGQMLSGEWLLSPQGLSFSEPDDNGVEDMTDGQHRLLAVIAADKEHPGFAVPFTIASNVPGNTKMVLDTGNSRKPMDFLSMQGETYANLLAPAVKMLYCYDEIPFKSIPAWRGHKMTPQAQKAFLDKHEGLRSGLSLAQSLKTLAMPYVMTVVYYLIAREHGSEKAQEFLFLLEKGLAPGATTEGAPWKLREFLGAQKRQQYRWDGFEQLALIILAVNDWLEDWNAFRASAQLKMIKSPQTARFPRLIKAKDVPETLL